MQKKEEIGAEKGQAHGVKCSVPVARECEFGGSATGEGHLDSEQSKIWMRKHFDIVCEQQIDALEAHHNLRPESLEMIKTRNVRNIKIKRARAMEILIRDLLSERTKGDQGKEEEFIKTRISINAVLSKWFGNSWTFQLLKPSETMEIQTSKRAVIITGIKQRAEITNDRCGVKHAILPQKSWDRVFSGDVIRNMSRKNHLILAKEVPHGYAKDVKHVRQRFSPNMFSQHLTLVPRSIDSQRLPYL